MKVIDEEGRDRNAEAGFRRHRETAPQKDRGTNDCLIVMITTTMMVVLTMTIMLMKTKMIVVVMTMVVMMG